MDDKSDVIRRETSVNDGTSADDMAFLHRLHSVARISWSISKWTTKWLLRPAWNTLWAILLGAVVVPLIEAWLKVHRWFDGG